MTFSVESVICRLAGSCMSDHLPSVLSHVSWKNDLLSKDPKLPTLKAQIQMLVTSLPKTVTAFEPGRSFFQLTWLKTASKWPLMQEPANRHMTDSTENVMQNNFYRFFRGFQRFFHNSWKPVYRPVEGLEKKWKKEIRSRRSLDYCNVRRKMVSFKSRTWSVWAKGVLKGFGWFNLIHLDRVWPPG